MKQITFLILTFVTAYLSLACLNEFHMNSKGEETRDEAYRLIDEFETHFDKKEIDEWLSEYDLENVEQYDKEIQSDIAVKYLKLGQFEKALPIFRKLVKEFPEQYEFNSNLGTTYELIGQNRLALKYIKKGLEINPSSHKGSEWIHVKILESKIGIDKNPKWLEEHKFLDLDAKFADLMVRYSGQERRWVFNILTHLDYQLRTRIPFVPNPDLHTCLMFKEFSEFVSKHHSTSLAHGYAIMANYYAPTEALKQETESLVIKNKELTNKHYKGQNTIELKPLEYFLNKNNFVDGVNGVNWKKSTLTATDYQLIKKRKQNPITIKMTQAEKTEISAEEKKDIEIIEELKVDKELTIENDDVENIEISEAVPSEPWNIHQQPIHTVPLHRPLQPSSPRARQSGIARVNTVGKTPRIWPTLVLWG